MKTYSIMDRFVGLSQQFGVPYPWLIRPSLFVHDARGLVLCVRRYPVAIGGGI